MAEWSTGEFHLRTDEECRATCGNVSASTEVPTMPLRPGVYLVTSHGLVWLNDSDGDE